MDVSQVNNTTNSQIITPTGQDDLLGENFFQIQKIEGKGNLQDIKTISQTAIESKRDDLRGWCKNEITIVTEEGLLIYSQKRDENDNKIIFIDKRESKKAGFGTDSTRKMMKLSFDTGCEGRLSNEAFWTSHLFHLYMGMIPADKQLNAINTYFGMFGEIAVSNFSEIIENFNASIPLSTESTQNLDCLKKILFFIRTGTINNNESEKITLKEVVGAKEEILEFSNKNNVSYLKIIFIPRLLTLLEKQINKTRPDTTSLGSVNMEMSKEGIEQWKESIDNKKSFTSFKRMEQLRPYMDQKQIERLDRILELRNGVRKMDS
jgi:hypothetical protein